LLSTLPTSADSAKLELARAISATRSAARLRSVMSITEPMKPRNSPCTPKRGEAESITERNSLSACCRRYSIANGSRLALLRTKQSSTLFTSDGCSAWSQPEPSARSSS
jgi:hypothetical protein